MAETDEQQAPKKRVRKAKKLMVEPLPEGAYQMLMQVLDEATIKGRDDRVFVKLRLELARVAGIAVRQ